MGTVPSRVAAGIAAAGSLHSSAAARRRLLPPREGRAERRLRRPGAPSRTGRAGGPGSAAGPAPGAAGGRDWGRAARAGGGGSARRLDEGREGAGPRGSQTAGPAAATAPAAKGASAKCHAALGPQRRSARAPGPLETRRGAWRLRRKLRAAGAGAPGALGREPSGRGAAEAGDPEAARAPPPARQLRAGTRGPLPRRGLRHSHPPHATPTARRHTHAGPAAGCRRPGSANTRLERLAAEPLGSQPARPCPRDPAGRRRKGGGSCPGRASLLDA